MTEDNRSESYDDYLARAAHACEQGDLVLGMHLYLAAYEKAVADPDVPDGMGLAGLREAWDLACSLKERTMAEYVFEKLEPFLTGAEIAEYANELQDLALDRLAEYGFSREELQDMAEMITQDIADGDASIVKVESISIPSASAFARAVEELPFADGFAPAQVAGAIEPAESAVPEDAGPSPARDAGAGPFGPAFDRQPAAAGPGNPEQAGLGHAPADFNPYDLHDTSSVGKSYHAATNDGSGSYVFTRDKDRAAASEQARSPRQAAPDAPGAVHVEGVADDGSVPAPLQVQLGPESPAAPGPATAPAPDPQAAFPALGAESETGQASPAPSVPAKRPAQELPAKSEVPKAGPPSFSYRGLAGYDEAISLMREFGIGLQRDPGFRNFVAMMNSRHGLDRMPALDTLLFRSPAVEDATRFVDATIGELGLPVLRMSMEEGAQGMPVLCVTAQGDSRPRMNHSHNRFDGPGVLVIDDLDMWSMPQPPEGVEGFAGFVMANMSRGAREAVGLIRSAVEDPDVFVLVTSSTHGDADPFFYDLLEPISIIDIGCPTERERADIWNEILNDHPSMRLLDRTDLLRYSAGLPRYDIYMAARAAVEEAYKAGLVQRMFLPVTAENMLDKLAACQPLDSDEYRAIEEALVSSFRDGLDSLEGLVDGPRD